jgi:hypothetical protein
MSTPPNRYLVRWYFTLAMGLAVFALLWLLCIPSAQGVLSPGRLLLISPLLALISLLAWLTFSLWRKPATLERWTRSLTALLESAPAYWGALTLSGVIGVVCLCFLIMSGRTTDLYIKAYLDRLTAYAVWGVALSIQTLVFARLLRHGASLAIFRGYRKAFQATLVFLGLFLALAALIAWTRLGLAPDRAGWGIPGVPLLHAQIWLALGITFTLLAAVVGVRFAWHKLFHSPPAHLPAKAIDALICLALWGGAVWLWSSQPLKPNYFAIPPTPPNQEYYPYSDAATYDISAQKLLIGIGFERDVIRPIYSLFLALAHGISGLDYQSAIIWQVPALAAIPGLLYLLGKALHHRLSGLTLGILVILHESNTLALTGKINVSSSKLIMSDLPITMGVILFCLLAVHWLKRPAARSIYPFLAGGVLGISMLIRTQVIVVLPALLALAWFAYPRRARQWLANSLLLLAGLMVALAPWLWRNWSLTGKVILADTSNVTQAGFVSSRYSSLEPGDYDRLPGESEADYLARMQGSAWQYVREHPLETAHFITNHFWHNQLSTLFVLPVSFPVLTDMKFVSTNPPFLVTDWRDFRDKCCSLRSYVDRMSYWLRLWNGAVEGETILPLIASLLFISIGAGIGWSRTRTASLAPLAVSIGYALSNALTRNSGWRYNLPVDWVGMLYYSLGVMQACFWLGMLFANRFLPQTWEPGREAPVVPEESQQRTPWRQVAAAGLVFFLLTAAIPITERAIPERYQGMAPQKVLASLKAEEVFPAAGIEPADIEEFLKEGSAQALVGRALYPRFYPAGEGAPSDAWASYAARDYPRLGLYLIPGDVAVVLPRQQSPTYFPHGSDVLVMGCQRGDYLEAFVVVIMGDTNTVTSQTPRKTWDCAAP